MLEHRITDVPGIVGFGAGEFFDSAVPISLGWLVALLSWPMLSTLWPRIWSPGFNLGGTAIGEHHTVTRPAAGPYLLASIFPIGIILAAAAPAPALPEGAYNPAFCNRIATQLREAEASVIAAEELVEGHELVATLSAPGSSDYQEARAGVERAEIHVNDFQQLAEEFRHLQEEHGCPD
jgi:hypothetical protein